MITKFFKNKTPIVIDLYTADPEIYSTAAPNHASKFLPDWWRKLPASYMEEEDLVDLPTMKGCPGFVEYYKKGFMIPLWSDLRIEMSTKEEELCRWQFADSKSKMVTHDQRQRGDFLAKNITHFKIVSPWRIVCNEDIKWILSIPNWSMNETIDIYGVTGVTDFFYNYDCNMNFFMQYLDHKRIIDFEKGMPILHCIPLSERPIKMNYHLVDASEIYKKAPIYYRGYFKNRYYKFVNDFKKKK